MEIYLLCIVGVFVISAICGFVFIPIILNYCKAKQLYDIPNARKIHSSKVSRLGGISFIPSMIISFIIATALLNVASDLITVNLWSIYFLIGILLIYGMGILDDILGLTPMTKFIVQIIAACILPCSGLYINNLYGFLGITEIPYVIGFPLTVLIIVFIDNAINLIDGIDGLAGSLAILALAGFLYIFMGMQLWSYSILIAGLIGVLVAFLYFNIFGKVENNRKIFMGDAGSLTLGYILGFLCVKYSMDNVRVMPQHEFHFLMAFTLLIVPMFDVVRVSLYRIRHGQSPFKADKNHIHHKFMRAGLTQHQTLIIILLFQLFYIILNYFLFDAVSSTLVFIIDVVIYIIVNLTLNFLISKKAPLNS